MNPAESGNNPGDSSGYILNQSLCGFSPTTATSGTTDFRALAEVRFVLDQYHRYILLSKKDFCLPDLIDLAESYYCDILMEESTLVVRWKTPLLPPKSVFEKVSKKVHEIIGNAIGHEEFSCPRFSTRVLYPTIHNELFRKTLVERGGLTFNEYGESWHVAEAVGTLAEVANSVKCMLDFLKQCREKDIIVAKHEFAFLSIVDQCDPNFLTSVLTTTDSVKVQMKSSQLIGLSGPEDHLDLVVRHLMDTLSTMVENHLPLPAPMVNWLNIECHLHDLQALLVQQGIKAALVVKSNDLYVYGINSYAVSDAIHIVQNALIFTPVEMPFEESHILLDRHHDKPELSRILDCPAKIVLEKGTWHVVGWRKDIRKITENLYNFLKKNTPVKRKMECSEAHVTFVRRYRKADVEAIIAELTDEKSAKTIQVTDSTDGFIIEGTSDLVDCVREKLLLLIEKIEFYCCTVDPVPNVQELLQSRLNEIENRTETVIRLCPLDKLDSSSEYPNHSGISSDAFDLCDAASSGSKTYSTQDLQIQPQFMELCDIKADVLVNSVDWGLDLTLGVISQSVSKRAGPSLQKELNNNYPKGLKFFQYAITKSFDIKCMAIIHVACSVYCGKYTEEQLRSVFLACLKEAEKRKAASIAFPPIGTGKLGYPPTMVFKLLRDAVAIFRSDYQKSSLKSVYCSLVDPEHQKVFADCNKENLNRGTQQRSLSKARKPDTSDQLAISIKNSTLRITQNVPNRDWHVVIQFDDLKKPTCKERKPTRNAIGCVFIDKDLCSTKLTAALEKAIKNSESFDDNVNSLSIIAHKNDKKTARCMAEALRNYCGKDRNVIAEISVIVNDEQLPTYCQTFLAAFFQAGAPSFMDRFARLPIISWVSFFANKPSKDNERSEDGLGVTICGTPSGNKEAVKLLTDLLNQECDIEVVPFHSDDFRMFNDKQFCDLIDLGPVCRTIITILDDQQGICIRGRKEDIRLSREKIKDCLSSAREEWHKSEMVRQRLEMAKSLYRWQYQDDSGQWTYLDDITNMAMEESFSKKIPCSLQETSVGDFSYDPCASPATIFSQNGSKLKRYKTRRIDVREWQCYPKEWTYCEDSMECSLSAGSEEYILVESEFLNNAGASANEVVEIKRIQHLNFWKQFELQKRRVASQLMSGSGPLTRRLWHGTSSETVSAILKDSRFNRRFAGDEVLYGKGVYFARDASYAAQPQYAVPSKGVRTVILAEVITGCFTKGTPDMIVPPGRQDGSGYLYDSTVDDEADPSIFVVFHDAQAYPLYVVQFK